MPVRKKFLRIGDRHDVLKRSCWFEKPASKLHSLVFRTGLTSPGQAGLKNQRVWTGLTGPGQAVRTDLTGAGQAGLKNQRVRTGLTGLGQAVWTNLTGAGQAGLKNQRVRKTNKSGPA
ncbi:hypothetical protein TIFTF001_054963 [Ficus carica]|uniref:Uncharacterized protein n=2 Tax=Ficus carica TaxID=3494 RepID=A0AA88EFR6_FICCA|nr:hypothetical protein TIFTF001_054961 [Ficus carica]GMN74087.1 hypothetical protein TIFTF001_054963 [Ficus carica]